jgi:uncharacterized membrane protein
VLTTTSKEDKKQAYFATVVWIIGITALVLFFCSSLKHILFKSTTWDLGVFHQAVYLISQGQPPISSYLGYHIIGDHAAWIWYPLALLYKIYPSVYWLFAVQAIALSISALPTWYLSRQGGLKESQAIAMVVICTLYPLVFNINLFDFHPDVIALPLLLGAVWFARQGLVGWFCVATILILGCKAVFSLTVVGMGVWLLIFEKRRWCGAIAVISGIAWFVIATKGIIPFFGDSTASIERHLISRYQYLGHSFPEVVKNLLFNPGILLGHVFSLENFGYLVLLLIPVVWGLSPAGLKPLLGAIPCLALNLLADTPTQKDLLYQYSIPALPFLLLAVIQTLAAGKGWLQSRRAIILWSLITFLALAKFTHFTGKYLTSIDTWQATREAVALVQTKGAVLTTDEIAPHLSDRQIVNVATVNLPASDYNKFDYILLNVRHPGLQRNSEVATNMVNTLKTAKQFQTRFQRDDVYLFVKKS